MAASYGGREARLLEAGLALTLDRELPAVLRRLVALASELTGARSSVLGVLGANNVVVEVISTAPDGPDLGPAGLPAPGPGVLRLRVKVRGVAFGDLCVTGKRDAADFDEDDRRALEALAAYAGVAIENARLLVEAEGSARRLEALREVAAKMLAGSPLDQLLELIASHAIRLARAEGASVLVPGPREGTLVMEVVIGPTRGLRGVEIPIDHSVAGRVIQTGKAEVELVEGFADLAAVAYEYASVHRELRRLAIMEERERIARDLHDGAIQALFSVGMGLQATAARTGEPEVTRRLHGAVGELDRVISDLRSYIFGLRPGVLAGRHIDQALRRLAEEIAMPAGVTTVVEVEEQVAAALSQHAGELVQVVREALSNDVRHARATTCRVSLYWRQGSVGGLPGRVAVLEVDDDGVGFDPRASRPGHGLGNLSARAAALGGSLELESSSGEGTTVRVLIPL